MGPGVFFGVPPPMAIKQSKYLRHVVLALLFRPGKLRPSFILFDKIAKLTKTIIMQIKQI